VDVGTKQYLYGAGGGVLAGSMMSLSLTNSAPTPALKLIGATMAGGVAGGLMTAAIAKDEPGGGSGGRRLAGLGASLVTGAIVAGAAGGAMHLGGSSRASIAWGAAAGAIGGTVGAMLALTAE